MSIKELMKHFLIIKIELKEEEIESVYLRDATLAFHNLAMILHPDKAG